jgi:two-component system CheB/CheR fusion protein
MATRGKRQRRAAVERPALSSPSDPVVVAIGASAGGFDAICALLRAMPTDGGLAILVVQHLLPAQKSLSAELFARRTAMTVAVARHGERLRADRVYTIPPDVFASVIGGIVWFEKPDARDDRHHPIDHLFASLGDDRGERAIGVILSGTGSDGSIGLKSIAEHGGVILVQSPETAQFDGMPRSAIATGLVSRVLPVDKMPAAILAHARRTAAAKRAAAAADPDAAAFGHVLDVIRRDRGFSFAGYKQRMLLRRVRRRMQLCADATVADYLERVRRDPKEVEALFKDMLIGVTEFFRDAAAWQFLDTRVVKPLIAAKGTDETVRIWVAATGSGEEAYTLAMLLLERIRLARKRCKVQVFATDRNLDALERARAGIYPAHDVARVPARLRARYFARDEQRDEYRVTKELRDCVVFGPQNLFADPPFSRVDLVTCRNLLIYLEPDVQQRVLRTIHFALNRGGHLFLGSAETGGEPGRLFEPVSRKWRVYRRLDVASYDRMHWTTLPAGAHAAAHATKPSLRTPHPVKAADLAQQVILEHFAPASVLVNERGDALYFAGPTERYVRQPRGAPVVDVLSLAREGLRSQLRNALRRAGRRNAGTIVSEASVKRDGRFQPVTLTITPIVHRDGDGRLVLVVFREGPRHAASARRAAGATGHGVLVKRLEEELRVTKDDLQSTIERLAASNDEMRDANEEATSVNEELQSMNEELESSKEELQSLNEELNAVNQQLQGKIEELEAANNDLKNLLSSSDVATVCVDRRLRIKWFTPAAREALRMIDADVGRPISDLGSPLAGATLVKEARTVIENAAPVQSEVHTPDGRWYLRRVLPYRTESERIDGAVVNFNDFTETRLFAEQAVVRERTNRELVSQVDARTSEVAALASELALAEERERAALARDLHDNLGQLLNVAQLKIAAVAGAAGGPAFDGKLGELKLLVDQATAEARSLATQLHPPVLAELGLVPALEWLSDEMKRQYGLAVDLHDDGVAKPLSQEKRSIVFRAVRELLVNAAKHARVARAAVATAVDDGRLMVTVSDRGVGFDSALVATTRRGPQCLGLKNVRERLRFVQGTFEIASAAGDGTTAKLRVPLDDAVPAAERDGG